MLSTAAQPMTLVLLPLLYSQSHFYTCIGGHPRRLAPLRCIGNLGWHPLRRGGQFGSPRCFLLLRLTKTTCPLFPLQKCVLTGDSQHEQRPLKYTVHETQVQSINKRRDHVEHSPVCEMNENVERFSVYFAVLAKHFGHILTVFTELSRKLFEVTQSCQRLRLALCLVALETLTATSEDNNERTASCTR